MNPDPRLYYSVENTDRSMQILMMPVVNFVSTVVTVILFYLIFKHSEKESSSHKIVIFFHNFSLYLAQLTWGSIINMVFLLPFPAVYSIGPFKDYLNCFYQSSIWFALFGWSVLMMFWILLVRLKALARRDSIFCFSRTAYNSIIFLLMVYVFVPIQASWFPGYSSEEKTREYVLNLYPNCLKALELTGIFVNTSPAAIIAVTVSAFGLLSTGALLYIFSLLGSGYMPLEYLLDPARDTIMITMLANIIFVAAPIPCTIVMFVQNRAYRNFFLQKLRLRAPIQDGLRKTSVLTVRKRSRISN